MSKPIAVLISDIHYNLHTLPLADKAMRLAIEKANELEVPLIVAGDLHDTKANLRGECINAMISTFMSAKLIPTILIGNHDRINEKSESHSLNFLNKYAFILTYAFESEQLKGAYFIPYHHDSNELKTYIKTIPKGSTLIMHQGLINSDAGHYIQDKSAITKEDVAGMRVISGHYHTRQTIDLPDNGKWDYIGNPYTLGFGEANDPPKGFQILMSDGSLEFVPTNLRYHRILNLRADQLNTDSTFNENDNSLLWIKVTGTKEDLQKVSKDYISKRLQINKTFKLDLIPTDTTTDKTVQKENKTQSQVLDSLIDSLTETSDTRKMRIKHLWKEFTD